MCRFQKCLYLILRMLPCRATGFAEKSSSPLHLGPLLGCANAVYHDTASFLQIVQPLLFTASKNPATYSALILASVRFFHGKLFASIAVLKLLFIIYKELDYFCYYFIVWSQPWYLDILWFQENQYYWSDNLLYQVLCLLGCSGISVFLKEIMKKY